MSTLKTILDGGDIDITGLAELSGHRTRSAMLCVLLDRKSLFMSMLACEAGVSPSIASEHLTKLVIGGLLQVHKQRKCKYYALALPDVATALEALAQIVPPVRPIQSLRVGTRINALRTVRSCYDHLAGQLGIALSQSLLNDGTLLIRNDHFNSLKYEKDINYTITESGNLFFTRMDTEFSPSDTIDTRNRQKPISFCLDWTERCHHLRGILGASPLNYFQRMNWADSRFRKLSSFLVTDIGKKVSRNLLLSTLIYLESKPYPCEL